jgi:hypothetical protein
MYLQKIHGPQSLGPIPLNVLYMPSICRKLFSAVIMDYSKQSTLKMIDAWFSKMHVPTYQTTQCHNTEDCYCHQYTVAILSRPSPHNLLTGIRERTAWVPPSLWSLSMVWSTSFRNLRMTGFHWRNLMNITAKSWFVGFTKSTCGRKWILW